MPWTHTHVPDRDLKEDITVQFVSLFLIITENRGGKVDLNLIHIQHLKLQKLTFIEDFH